MSQRTPTLKFLFVGNSGVGKTTILTRYIDRVHNPSSISTIGIDFRNKDIQIDQKLYKLQIWDTAGQERFRCITASARRNVVGMIFVFDVTNKVSFDNIRNWVKLMHNEFETIQPISVLIGNKIDQQDRRAVSTLEGRELASEFDMKYFETSTVTGEGIDHMFHQLTQEVIAKDLTLPTHDPNYIPINYKWEEESVKRKCCF